MIIPAWEKLGGTIVANNPVDYNKEVDFNTFVSKALAAKPDVMFIGGPSQPTAKVVKQARQLGFKGGFIVMDQAKLDQMADVVSMSDLEGSVGVCPIAYFDSPGTAPFVERYKAKHAGKVPSSEQTYNYEHMMLLVKGIEKSGSVTDATKIFEGMKGVMPLTDSSMVHTLAQRLDKNPVGAPLNSTLIKILHIMFTETQALIGSKFPLEITSLDHLVPLTGLNPIELDEHLNSMADKGLVIDFSRNGVSYYMLSPLVVGFFEYTFMRVNDTFPMHELALLFHAYHNEPGVVKEFFGSNTKFFQAMVYESLLPEDVETEVLSYEKASQIIRDSGGRFSNNVLLSPPGCSLRHQKM